jgi:hypothetical protein
MIDRLYKPSESDVIYHYCSAATFQAIVESGNIRFSDINMLNDASEVRWSYGVFEEAANRLLQRVGMPPTAPHIDRAFIDAIDEIVSPSQLIGHPFIACFSQERDILGQWRAYADDGRGYAIGFKAALLAEQLPATFFQVEYNRELQVKEMMQAIMGIYIMQQEENDAAKSKSQFAKNCFYLATFMVAFKHPAFAEEKEIRAVHLAKVEPRGNLWCFTDKSYTEGESANSERQPVAFQVRDNRLVAYIDAKFASPSGGSPLTEAVLGPKNYNVGGNLTLFLGGAGLTDVTLYRSNAPYR